MDFLTCLTSIALGTSFVITCNQQREFSSFKVGVPSSHRNSQSKGVLDSNKANKANVSVTANLLPYEILDRQATSYADISLTLSNSSEQEIEVEVIRLEIVATDSGRALMSSIPQELQLPNKTTLRPGEIQTLEYRLQSESKLYHKGQDVIARIYYRQAGQPEQVIQSNPEVVAFMIP